MSRCSALRCLIPMLMCLVLILSSCAVPRKGGFGEVETLVKERSGAEPAWNMDEVERSVAASLIVELLEQELTAETAIRIALVNNQHLQATFEKLGVAQADLIQAGFLRNPVISGSILFSKPNFSSTMREASVGMDLLDLVLLPYRKGVAEQEFERAKLEVAHEILMLIRETRGAYYAVVAAKAGHALAVSTAKGGEASAKLLDRQRAAGNLSKRDQMLERELYQRAMIDLYQSELGLKSALSHLSRILGLSRPTLKLPAQLSEALPGFPDEATIAETARARRLDVAAKRTALEATQNAYELASGTRWIGGLGVGASFERDPGGAKMGGPTMELELPIFDQKQASLARMAAEVRAAERELAALENDVNADVEEAAARMSAAGQVVNFYRTEVVPSRRSALEETILRYNGMLAGTHELIAVKREELSARREHIDALRDYWDALAELELAAGGSVADSLNPAPNVAPLPAAIPPRDGVGDSPQSGYQHH